MQTDYITIDQAKTLAGLLRHRIERSPHKVAYQHYDRGDSVWRKLTWHDVGTQVARWQAALENEPHLQSGDRVAIMCRNCPQWTFVDQAVLGMGLVIVPLYVNDNAENVAYILENAGIKLLVVEGKEQWDQLHTVANKFTTVKQIISLQPLQTDDKRIISAADWLPDDGGPLRAKECDPHELATIVYTSGTTGNPKGVMLSHHNILWNAWASGQTITVYPDDLMLSFLPLSHMFERTTGYYLSMMSGNQVAYARSVPELPDDLLYHKPTVLISVPRIFERVYARIISQVENRPAIAKFLFHKTLSVGWKRFEHRQRRSPWGPSLLLWPLLNKLVAGKILARLGGRMRVTICGGAPLSKDVGKLFLSMGLDIVQGYGLTETSPVLSANRIDNNEPSSIGSPVIDVEVRIGEKDELLAKSPGIMMGYWQNPQATKDAIDKEGWFHTGDKARIDDGRIYITGRIKEIIVLANGEKVPPADMEMAIISDPLFEQALVLGEGKPYLSAIVILNVDEWKKLTTRLQVSPDAADSMNDSKVTTEILNHISATTKGFPGYAQIRRVALHTEPWTIENALMTPTLKLKRNVILEHHKQEVGNLYEGH